MKKLFIILLILFSYQLTKAQGNLQFNAVKNIEMHGAGYPAGSIGTITVPSGKVWKIESVHFSSGENVELYGSSGKKYNLFIDKHLVFSNRVTSGAILVKLPIWFPSGTFDVVAETGSGYSGYAKISAIEFNVVAN